MAIDWLRVQPQLIAEDRNKSYYKYWTDDVAGDLAKISLHLQTYPRYELVACKNAILAIFDWATIPDEKRLIAKLGATLDAIADEVLEKDA